MKKRPHLPTHTLFYTHDEQSHSEWQVDFSSKLFKISDFPGVWQPKTLGV